MQNGSIPMRVFSAYFLPNADCSNHTLENFQGKLIKANFYWEMNRLHDTY